MLKLTPSNYYSTEANMEYWSASLVKEFLSCPARAYAEMTGNYDRPASEALLVGGYVDAYFDGTLPEFIADHPEICKRDGTLKAVYGKADQMIQRAEADPVFMDYMEGEKQRIVTGEIGGMPFKAKFDVYDGRRIVDLKTVKDMRPVYKPGEGRMTFADAWNWPLQMAIYQALEGHRLPCYLAVITKEDPPDIEVIEVPQDKMDAELDFLLEKLPYFDAIKQGIVEPDRCENCAYCRMTKKLNRPRLLDEFEDFGGIDHE